MEINAVTTSIPVTPQPQPAPIEEPQETQPPVPIVEVADQPQEESTEVPGVIRNLQKGHFKGVADIRLRLVHAEKLQALEEAKLQEVMQSETEFLSDFDTNLEQLLAYAPTEPAGETSTEPLTENPVEGTDELPENSSLDPTPDILTPDQLLYATQSQDQIAALLNAHDLPKDTIIGMIGELSTTVGNLSTALIPPSDPPPADLSSELDILAESLDTLAESFVNVLIPEFQTALEELTSSLSTSVLPKLTAPTGNGKAYEKFLDMYMSPDETTDPADSVNTLNAIA
jgi:hypothetical protein